MQSTCVIIVSDIMILFPVPSKAANKKIMCIINKIMKREPRSYHGWYIDYII